MPAIETRDLYQSAVLWPAAGYADPYGDPVVGSAVEIPVRWLTGRRDQAGAQQGTTSYDAQVITDRDVKVGSRLWLGTLDTYLGTGSDDVPSNVHIVVASSSTPDLKARFTRYTLGLVRYREARGPSS